MLAGSRAEFRSGCIGGGREESDGDNLVSPLEVFVVSASYF